MLPAPSAAQEWVVNMTFSAVHDVSHLYFVTASIAGWKHLLSKPAYIQIVLDSLVWFQNEKRILLFAFVIMPSHLHMILKPEEAMIGDVIRDFGSYTAHAILHELHKDKMQDLLLFFHQQRRDARHKHSIWQDIQAKNVYSHAFLSQKLDYIHGNPVSKKWRLAANQAAYKYSSACFYEKGLSPIIPITDINEWLMVSAAEDGGWSL
jgi:REP element-mobilizing transposase RayT